jgi:hypothetical protein
MQKQCTKCLRVKPFDDFYANKRKPNGLESQCKVCSNEQVRRYRLENPETVAAIQRRSYRKNVESIRAQKLRLRYGITVAEYEQRLTEQGGTCAVCQGPNTGNSMNGKPHEVFAVDHDHETGAVRGLLCQPCNRGLGNFRDQPELLRRAIDYLNSHKE